MQLWHEKEKELKDFGRNFAMVGVRSGKGYGALCIV
jgi:hypothetical protein